MTSATLVRSVGIVALVAAATLTGCARRTPEPPPTPPTAQATPAPVPAPTPPPTSESTPPTTIGSTDFQPAFFDFDSYTLREDARTALDHNARLLRENASAQITIEGHADERGTSEYNQALGERRAESAKDYLVAAGIDAGRIQTVSYGKERPFATGHDEASWQQNRRAHIVTR